MSAIFHARVAHRPAFPTSQEAVQFERGFSEWPNQPPGLPYGPRMDGYRAAEWAAIETAHPDRRAASLLTEIECNALEAA